MSTTRKEGRNKYRRLTNELKWATEKVQKEYLERITEYNNNNTNNSIIVYVYRRTTKFALEQAMKAQRGSRGIILLFL